MGSLEKKKQKTVPSRILDAGTTESFKVSSVASKLQRQNLILLPQPFFLAKTTGAQSEGHCGAVGLVIPIKEKDINQEAEKPKYLSYL